MEEKIDFEKAVENMKSFEKIITEYILSGGWNKVKENQRLKYISEQAKKLNIDLKTAEKIIYKVYDEIYVMYSREIEKKDLTPEEKEIKIKRIQGFYFSMKQKVDKRNKKIEERLREKGISEDDIKIVTENQFQKIHETGKIEKESKIEKDER